RNHLHPYIPRPPDLKLKINNTARAYSFNHSDRHESDNNGWRVLFKFDDSNQFSHILDEKNDTCVLLMEPLLKNIVYNQTRWNALPMNLSTRSDFPFKSVLSLRLLVEYWEKAIVAGKVPSFAHGLLDDLAKVPEL